MVEIENKLRLERYRLPCESVCQFNCQLDQPLGKSSRRLIGYPHFADIFYGLVPLTDYDDKGNFAYLNDFPEIFPNEMPTDLPAFQKTGSAVLFTGETGCGKHTADYTFMRTAYGFVESEVIQSLRESGDFSHPRPSDLDDMTLQFYRIDQTAYDVFSERQLGEALQSLFAQITDKAFSNPAVLYYFSMGDVTRILDSKRLAPVLIDYVHQLTTDPRARCILTCIYTGKAAQIPANIKKPFYVLEMTPPEKPARTEYFRYLRGAYPNVRFGLDESQLSDLTDGFTFAQIKQLAGYLLMSVKTELKKKKLKVSNVRFDKLPEQDIIILPEQTIDAFADMIRQSQSADVGTAPAQTARETIPVPRRAENTIVSSGQSSPGTESEKSNDDNDADEKDIKDAVKKKVDEIDTPSELRKVSDELPKPIGYKPTMLMEHRVFYTSVFRIYAKDLRSFLMKCSEKGLTNLSNLQAVSISTGGNLEFLIKNKSLLKPLPQGKICDYKIIIYDGKISLEALRASGKDNTWLAEQLRKNGCQSISEVFLGACDENNEMMVFRKRESIQ